MILEEKPDGAIRSWAIHIAGTAATTFATAVVSMLVDEWKEARKKRRERADGTR